MNINPQSAAGARRGSGMILGQTILSLRLQKNKTQRDLSELTGLAVSYVSRLENGRIMPSIRTLAKISEALEVPLTSFFDGEPGLESGDRCPVTPSGRCILDQAFTAAGPRPNGASEIYSPERLHALRLCNVLLQTADPRVVKCLTTIIEELLALAASSHDSPLKKSLQPSAGGGGRA